jgi:NOL1/NOP2/sun family putative RNA methylase
LTEGYFLKRYRTIRPDTTLIDPQSIRPAIRVNTTRTTHSDLIRTFNRGGAFLTKIPFLQDGYWVEAKFSLGSSPEHLFGQYYVQAPLSQLVTEILDPPAGARVLDMAAAPGGKATHIAQRILPGGSVVALDTHAARLAAVRNNAERLGLPNIVCVRKDARYAHDLKEQFSSILLDAPCSGNYCSDESWVSRRTIEDIRASAKVQRELIREAVACLAPGGTLVYSTCSLEPEEDECMIDWALATFPELDVLPIDDLPIGDPGRVHWEGKNLDPRVAGTRRFWPHLTGCEGFFIAKLRRKA